MLLIIYLIGVIVSLISLPYIILKCEDRITIGDIVIVIIGSACSWIILFVGLLIAFGDFVIYTPKKK